MMFLNNDDAAGVLTMKACMEALEEGIREYYNGDATCRPRIDVWAPCGVPDAYFQWGSMEGTSKRWRVFALRIKSDIATFPKGEYDSWTHEYYCQRPGKFLGLILLFSLENGEPLAIMNDGVLQHMRVGATAGLGAKHLAREDAATVGIIGSGGMARTHAMALVEVRKIKTIKVYSPTEKNRTAYAEEMARLLGLEVRPVKHPEEAVRGSEIVACCTDSIVPVIQGEWLEEGVFVTTVKGTIELDDRAIERIDLALNLSPEEEPPAEPHGEMTGPQSHSGKHQAYVAGRPEELAWVPIAHRARPIPREKQIRFKDLLEGKVKGRRNNKQIISIGGGGVQGIQFASVGGLTYHLAKEKGLGRELPTDWFLQDIRN
jgi:ornithine cyclodeaminase/alanine dehydrogenase-like protein (mu-crystallin family)